MLDYKSILVKRFALGMSGRDIAKELGCSKSGINKFLVAFSKCDTLGYPLPREITNYAIHQEVYGAPPSQKGQRHEDYEKGRDLSWPLNSAAWPLRNALVATPARRMQHKRYKHGFKSIRISLRFIVGIHDYSRNQEEKRSLLSRCIAWDIGSE